MKSKNYFKNAFASAFASASIASPHCDRRTCVIDPALVLSPYGVPLVKELGKVIELWLGRELWHILNNSSLYRQQPESIAPKGVASQFAAREETQRSLQAWERFQLNTDLAKLDLFWLGDNLKDSLLPASRNAEIFWRWEAIAKSLDDRLQPSDPILTLAVRDAVALAIALDSAFILTCLPLGDFEPNPTPEICSTLTAWGVPCQLLPSQDSMASVERDYLRQLLVQASIAKFLWAGLRLAVLHLVVPASGEFETRSIPIVEEITDSLKPSSFCWMGVRGFWYSL
jgi:hypothetical protein